MTIKPMALMASARSATMRRRASGLVLLSLLLVVSCYGSEESSPEPNPDKSSDSTSAKTIPIAGSFVANSTDTGDPIRIGVIGVRRTGGATVLDYTVTRLSAGAESTQISLGADAKIDPRFLGNAPAIALIDSKAKNVYRPLSIPDKECLCTSVFEPRLKVDEPELHQAAFPELPADRTQIAVDFSVGPLIDQVPVLREGTIPEFADLKPTDSAPTLPVAGSTKDFTFPLQKTATGNDQPMKIIINSVVNGASASTLTWTVEATENGDGISSSSRPISDDALGNILNSVTPFVASGPGLRPSGRTGDPVQRALFATVKAKPAGEGSSSGELRLCLCSDYQVAGADVDAVGESRTFVTELPALAAGTAQVDVVFPRDTLPPVTGVKVDTAVAAQKLKTTSAPADTWSLGSELAKESFTVADWPTPVPDDKSISMFKPVVDTLLIKESDSASASEQNRKKVAITLDSTVSFAPDSAKLTGKAKKSIAAAAKQIDDTAKKGSAIAVDGYVAGSDLGSTAVQKKLSTDRAKAVTAELKRAVNLKVSFKAVGHGAEDPVAPNDTEENRRLNRRVVISFGQ